MKKSFAGIHIFFLLICSFAFASAQNVVELRGAVVDEFGAAVAGVMVTLDDGRGNKTSAKTYQTGEYSFTNIVAGQYTLTAAIAGFAEFSRQIDLKAGQVQMVNVTLKVVITDQIEVTTEALGVSTDPDQNLSATKLSEEEMVALPDDRDELLQVLQEMAGGSDDATVYIDGFSDDRLPPKDSIQAVRINSNPFSSEYSEPGRRRIEVITKPGSDRIGGNLRFNFNDEALNARNAASIRRAPLQIREFTGNLSGPIIRNRWGYFVEFEREEQDENAQINATVLDPLSLQPQPFFDVVVTPARETEFSIRTDYQVGTKHTLGFRYNYETETRQNQGLGGGFDLPERAFDSTRKSQWMRFSITSVINDSVVNDLRLSLSKRNNESAAQNLSPAIVVLDAFSIGGNQGSLQNDVTRNRLEFINNITFTRKSHTIKAGIRTERDQLDYFNRSNFGGTFTFGADFERDANGNIQPGADGQPVTITSLENYRRTLMGLPGYGPSQFSIVRGEPFTGLSQWEIAWFAQDDWRVSPRLTLSFGLRHEIETDLDDRMNIAPRVAFAWAADNSNNSVLRGGVGLFFDHLNSDITFDALRYDGIRQQQFIIRQPQFFPDIPGDLGEVTQIQPTLRTRAADLDAAYEIHTSISYERKLPWKMQASVAYNWQRGIHLLRTRNINAPLPGSIELPFPDQGPILQYESTGISVRHELRFNLQKRASRNLTLFGNYTLASARSDTDGAGTNPTNPYDLALEFARSNFDQRHRLFIGGSINLPGSFRISPFIRINSGRPFNITTGQDNNGDTRFTDRPAFALPGDPEAIVTRFGIFKPNPDPDDPIIPRNYGRGPGQISFDVNFAKTFNIGERLSSDSNGNVKNDERFRLTLGANVRNIFNHTNPAGFSGVLSSPRFGIANRALAARRVELTLRFSF